MEEDIGNTIQPLHNTITLKDLKADNYNLQRKITEWEICSIIVADIQQQITKMKKWIAQMPENLYTFLWKAAYYNWVM